MSGPRILAIESSLRRDRRRRRGRRPSHRGEPGRHRRSPSTPPRAGSCPRSPRGSSCAGSCRPWRPRSRRPGVDWGDLDAVAVTYGPGLIGSLLVGVNVAKAHRRRARPAAGRRQPHRGPHLRELADRCRGRTRRCRPEPAFPLLCLVVSGGHTQLVLMHDHGRYTLLGQTVDDAAGEAFDKVGRLLDLPYPGGPAISAAAAGASARRPASRAPGPTGRTTSASPG